MKKTVLGIALFAIMMTMTCSRVIAEGLIHYEDFRIASRVYKLDNDGSGYLIPLPIGGHQDELSGLMREYGAKFKRAPGKWAVPVKEKDYAFIKLVTNTTTEETYSVYGYKGAGMPIKVSGKRYYIDPFNHDGKNKPIFLFFEATPELDSIDPFFAKLQNKHDADYSVIRGFPSLMQPHQLDFDEPYNYFKNFNAKIAKTVGDEFSKARGGHPLTIADIGQYKLEFHPFSSVDYRALSKRNHEGELYLVIAMAYSPATREQYGLSLLTDGLASNIQVLDVRIEKIDHYCSSLGYSVDSLIKTSNSNMMIYTLHLGTRDWTYLIIDSGGEQRIFLIESSHADC